MKLSLNWIKKFVNIDIKDPVKLGKLLTLRTAEVEGVENEAEDFEHMYFAEIQKIEDHPDADKLKICKLNINDAEKTVVCGGENIKEGMKIAFAGAGAKVKWHGEGEKVELKDTKVRGVLSEGMICAGEEIGLESDNPKGQKEVKIHDLSHINAPNGTPLAIALNKNDIVFEIDNKSLTHRPDLWGHYGFAREFSAILNKDLKKLNTDFKFDTASSKLKLNIVEKKKCPYFSGCIITNIKVEESPKWMQAQLQAVGIRPVNNVVDITNYIMLELGQPMHAYDRKILNEDFLGVRFAKNNEELETLDHKTRELTENDLVIFNSKGILGLAGIMGGVNCEINNETTEIILESANFDPVTVRKSSTFHGLRTDALQRFEKSLDPLMAKKALILACKLFKEICPSSKFEGNIQEINNYKTPNLQIELNLKNVNQIIGVEINKVKMIKNLEKLGFIINNKKDKLIINVPSWRATKDIEIQEDLIEEIARMYGYENIKSYLPPLPIKPPKEFKEREKKHIARRILAGLNCNEVIRYSFYSKKDVDNCFLNEGSHLRIQNYLSEDQTHMRISLLPNMIKAIHLNLKYNENVRIFEFGRTYEEIGYMPKEEKHLCCIIASTEKKKKNTPLKETFFDSKGTLEEFMNKFGANKFQLKKPKNSPNYAHPKQCLTILYRGKEIGSLFTIHPSILKSYDIKADTSAFEINFTTLINAGLSDINYSPIDKLPSLNFDISVIVNKQTEIETIEKIIKKECGKLIKNIKLFDIYEGENINKCKKALAFKITLQSNERTLTDNDMSEVQTKIFNQLIKIGGEIRGL